VTETTVHHHQENHQPLTAHEGAQIHNAPVNITLNLGKETLLVVVMLSLVIGACGLTMGLNLAKQSQMDRSFEDLGRKYRMAELKYDELNLTVRRAGIGRADDDQTGVGGNLDPEAFGEPFLHKRKGK
jgi:hypothetical protein